MTGRVRGFRAQRVGFRVFEATFFFYLVYIRELLENDPDMVVNATLKFTESLGFPGYWAGENIGGH